MGEAKYRRRTDPTYGRVPRDSGRRGLIVSAPIEIEGSRLYARSSALDPQELRYALLFWDQLVWPSSRAIHFASGADELFLESAGILTRPEYTFYGDAAQGIARSQFQAYLDRERAEPGHWALSQGENSLLWKDGHAQESAGVLVQLHRAIPVPGHAVPLAEVLEFRERRRDELLLLRHHLESFVAEIERSTDKTQALETKIAELDRSCADLLTLGREWQFPVYLSNLKASFSLSPQKLLPALGGGWMMGEPYGLVAATTAAAAGGLVSTLEIKADYGLRSATRPATPFRYVVLAERELR